MYKVYVLKDELGKLYKGVTNNIERRLREHRLGKTITTSRMEKLELAYSEEFDNFEEARKRELYFKSAAGRRYLKKILNKGV
jgi:putative endonuclease